MALPKRVSAPRPTDAPPDGGEPNPNLTAVALKNHNQQCLMSAVKTKAKTVKTMVAQVHLPDVSIVPGEIKGIVGILSDGLGRHYCPWILGRYVNDGVFVVEEGAIRIGFSRIALPKNPINKRCHTKVDSHPPPSLSSGLTTRLLAKKKRKEKHTAAQRWRFIGSLGSLRPQGLNLVNHHHAGGGGDGRQRTTSPPPPPCINMLPLDLSGSNFSP
jgi:hypothetical protein